jgi:hypothetical protein
VLLRHSVQIPDVRFGCAPCAVAAGLNVARGFFVHQDVLRMCGDGCRVTNMLASCFFLKTGIIHHSQ